LDLGDDDIVLELGTLIRTLGVTLIAGGPPCQAFSRVGRSGLRNLVRLGVRPEHDMRKDLWQSFLWIVSIARPKAVLMENVPDMALDRDMWILRTMVDELEEMGYSVEERVVVSSDYGVPQTRTRLILIALADGTAFEWPQPSMEVNLRNAIGDLPDVEGGWRPNNGEDLRDPVASGWTGYRSDAQTEFQRLMRSHLPAGSESRLYDHITRPVREDDALAFAQMDSNTRYADIDKDLQRYRSDIFDDKYKRLDWNGLSRTITAHIAKDGYGFIHPEQDRTLTVREAARIQTFGDHIRFAGPPSAAFRQIGNAVPPLLAEHLGSAIIESIDAAQPKRWSTRDTSRRLAKWFRRRKVLSLPWLKAQTRWQVIQGELLWSRLSRDHIQEAWAATSPLVTPTDSLDPANFAALELYAKARGRGDRISSLRAAAKWYEAHPGHVERDGSAQELASAPGVNTAVADLAVLVCPEYSEDRDEPVLITNGVLRVAARFSGENVERKNRYSDGRLAIARMIGGEDRAQEAHLALMELAASVCSPGRAPDCGHCPLLDQCHFAEENFYQGVLGVTSQAV
jgi:DNA (cytosine-5)-methyltransferase 1